MRECRWSALNQLTFNDRVALLGDPTHTHGGAFAAGASLAIDDPYAIYLSFRSVFPEAIPINEPASKTHIREAFALYEATRRPQSAKVLEVVLAWHRKQRECIQAAGVSGKLESDANFRARLAARDDSAWLTEHDVEAIFRNGLKAALGEGTVGACLPVVPLDLHLFESARL
jgi:salicylate hydroxylase